ncbi:hypothetical protein NHX12_011021 [Muraenolepis orangiensis]|uniref:Uncharacterized protein n=1 Tax=Muraenolepis orangiensis TaxID=630683 RepID=A0A9Q0I696_9TELE|nr:hypothetical protein NHX12_011021 [Muraenolepis orangiensis]
MPHAHFLAPTDRPGPPAAPLNFNVMASVTFDPFFTTTGATAGIRPPAGGGGYIQVHSVLITVVFSMVCLLLLVAFFYAFCFRCSIQPSPKSPRRHSHRPRSSLDREDATFGRSSSDPPSVGNVV